jgi:crotonobetainyl-CoA:carnitine CoA-transferase CaiB-like acyl-CoA transferase
MKVQRMGNQLGALSPAGIFRTQTGSLWIFAFQQNHWASLCEVMDRPELINDPRCAEHSSRVANRAFVNAEISKWLMTLPGNEAAMEIMREAHIPHAPVLSVEEAMAHPHLRERRTVRTVHDRILGDFQVPGFPLRFSAFPDELELDAPFLGEHNRKVLTEYLGYTEQQITVLERDGVLLSAPY